MTFSLITIVIFIIGYILGYLRLENLLHRIISEYSHLSLVSLIGFASSLITLLLFVMYILGRIILIKKMEVTLLESLKVCRDNELDDVEVVEEFTLGENNSEVVYLTSDEPMRYIKFYEYDFMNERNGTLLYQHGLLKNGYTIKINTYLTCGIPNYLIEYQRFDYVKGRVLLGENGKNGLIIENLEIKHTLKSIIYYLIK